MNDATRAPQVHKIHTTGRGFHIEFRPAYRFYQLQPGAAWAEAVAARTCRHARPTVGRLTAGSPWCVQAVFVPHEAVPFGLPEAETIARQVAHDIEAPA